MNEIIYLDYSATTPVSKEVLDRYYQDNLELIGNANSIHKLGRVCKENILRTSETILSVFGLDNDYEVIYTSGATEANNLAIKGIGEKKQKGRIISTSFEHPSVLAPLGYLQKKGFTIDFVKSDKNGNIDLSDLKRLMDDDVILVSISAVNSEIGIYQPLDEIKKIVKEYPNALLHIDMTQGVGKINTSFEGIDMFTYSAHKIYGLKGIGALIKKKAIKLEKQILGGKSINKDRSGTLAHPLIKSLGYATYYSFLDIEEKIEKVNVLKEYFISKLRNFKNVKINSNDMCIPHIVNVSFLNNLSKDIVLKLEDYNIYISNHSACSSDDELSKGVYALTNDLMLAKSSVRFSLSHLTTKEELDKVIEALEKII